MSEMVNLADQPLSEAEQEMQDVVGQVHGNPVAAALAMEDQPVHEQHEVDDAAANQKGAGAVPRP